MKRGRNTAFIILTAHGVLLAIMEMFRLIFAWNAHPHRRELSSQSSQMEIPPANNNWRGWGIKSIFMWCAIFSVALFYRLPQPCKFVPCLIIISRRPNNKWTLLSSRLNSKNECGDKQFAD